MKTEKTTISIFLIAFIAKMLGVPGFNIVIILSLFVTGCLYFPLAFYFFSDKSVKRQNMSLSITGGIILGIVTVGILFKLMYWPGAYVNLVTGVVLSAILLAVLFYLNGKAGEELKTYYKNYLTRTIFWFSVGGILLITPNATLIKIQNRDNPELARLKIQAYENPNNIEYQRALQDYYQSH